MRRTLFYLAFGVAVLGIVCFFNLRSPNIPDADSFYHIGHAQIYRSLGVIHSDFPWTQYSIIRTYKSDIWYGFHILLLPFTLFSDPVWGIKIGTIVLTSIVIALIAWSLRVLDRKRYILWLAIFLTSSSAVLFRLNMLRPHSLSLALAAAVGVLFYMENGTHLTQKRKHILLAIVGILFSWIHIAFVWLPVLIYVLWMVWSYSIARFFFKITGDVRTHLIEGAYMLIGLVAGWILRPHPIGALKIVYVQLVELSIIKGQGVPLKFGNELAPLNPGIFLEQLWSFVILYIAGNVACVYLILKTQSFRKDRRTAAMIATTFSLSLFFLGLTLFVAVRSLDLYVLFSILFVAVVGREYLALHPKRLLLTVLATVLMMLQILITITAFDSYMDNARSPDLMQGPARWLKENAPAQSIVFNPYWDRFGPLFMRNSNNYYINGMDPMFEYAYDPALYWETHYYSQDAVTAFTCPHVLCEQGQMVPTIDALKKDFHASYVVLENSRNPKFKKYLENAPGFTKVFDNFNESVFWIR